jgi:hypothetical protein
MSNQQTGGAPDVDEIISECFFAMGTGAGMPIKSDAVTKLRDMYRKEWVTVLQNHSNAWDDNGHAVLDYCRAVGRLAAQKAIAKGANRIEVTDAEQAAMTVQGWVQAQIARDTMFCI